MHMLQANPESRVPTLVLDAFHEQVTDLLHSVVRAYLLTDVVRFDDGFLSQIMPEAGPEDQEQLAKGLGEICYAAVDTRADPRIGIAGGVNSVGVTLLGPKMHRGTWLRTEVHRAVEPGRQRHNVGFHSVVAVPDPTMLWLTQDWESPHWRDTVPHLNSHQPVPEGSWLYTGLGMLGGITRALKAIER